jgi:hypothetical protein
MHKFVALLSCFPTAMHLWTFAVAVISASASLLEFQHPRADIAVDETVVETTAGSIQGFIPRRQKSIRKFLG